MPSALPLPTIEELERAFHDGAKSLDKRSDGRVGAVFDHFAGLGAMFFAREAQADQDLFRATYFEHADGADLTELVQVRDGIARLQDAYGTGTAFISRASAAAGAGTVWAGTRFVLTASASGERRVYACTTDTAIGATPLASTIPVRAAIPGREGAIDADTSRNLRRTIDDPLWDTSWSFDSVACDEGTTFEPADPFRARVRQTRKDARAGYRKSIIDAAIAVGAANVALFAGDYAGAAYDHGLNVCYVGDSSYVGSAALVGDVLIALESWRVLGAPIQVLPMASGVLSIDATVRLWSDPGGLPVVELRSALTSALVNYFGGREGGFAYRLDAMAGAMTAVAPRYVQSVVWTTPSSDLAVTTGSPPQFPATLTKWRVGAGDVKLAFLGPE